MSSTHYLKQFGSRILSEANDLKRTPEALARELSWDLRDLNAVLNGKGTEQQLYDLAQEIVSVYPVSIKDLWLDADDTNAGVLITRAEESKRTSRVFKRLDSSGKLSPYYEYRDTAMSRIGPYKPEWIKELRVVADSNPDNENVVFNRGHLMHQFTFFIGEVNFYFEDASGKKECHEMTTGDSCYITPFVPHSFTARSAEKCALILAVTFGGRARRAVNALCRLTPEKLKRIVGVDQSLSAKRKKMLKWCLDRETLSESELVRALQAKGVGRDRAQGILDGTVPPDNSEAMVIAEALHIETSALEPFSPEIPSAVVIQRWSQARARKFSCAEQGACRLVPLARTKTLSELRSFVLECLGNDAGKVELSHNLHEYIYNFSKSPILLEWPGLRREYIHPGDSAYVSPFVPHFISGPIGAKLLIVRVPGELDEHVFDELSTYPQSSLNRIIEENGTWF